MKEGVHPNYREVVFQDMSSGFKFITRSTLNTRETIKMEDGKEYPLMKLDVDALTPLASLNVLASLRARLLGEG